jgi:hypothetical protein
VRWSRRGTPGDPGRPDADLTFLTVRDATDLRAVVRSVLAGTGYEVAVHGGHVTTLDGREWGLWNLAVQCHHHPRGREAWPDLVTEHFTPLLHPSASDSVGSLDDDELRRRLFLRLVPEDSLAGLDRHRFEHARPWGDGLLEVPAVDLPRTVVTLASDDLRARGRIGPLLARARHNLCSLVRHVPLRREHLATDGHWCTVVHGESFFTASLVLVLPELLQHLEPGVDLSAGVVVATPHRHQLAYRVLDGPRAALDALTLLPGLAVDGWRQSAGPISPHTFLWRDGVVTRLTTLTDTALEVHPGSYLEGLLADAERA